MKIFNPIKSDQQPRADIAEEAIDCGWISDGEELLDFLTSSDDSVYDKFPKIKPK